SAGVGHVERYVHAAAGLRRRRRKFQVGEREGGVGKAVAEREQRLRLVRVRGVPAIAEEHAFAVFHGGVGARGMRWCVVEIMGGIVLPLTIETDRQLAFRRVRTEQYLGDRTTAFLAG